MSKSMLFLYAETPLHAGTGRGLGTVDLPIQRERSTGYPMIQASGIKGRLRAELKGKLSDKDLWAVFGPETDKAADHAGALSFGDARLLLFPVRSLAGVFSWVTSVDALARFHREAALLGQTPSWNVPMPGPKSEEDDAEAWVYGKTLKAGSKVVLEEFSFTAVDKIEVKEIGEWLAKHALPSLPEYDYWKAILPQKLCILPEDSYRDFTLYATEVQTHIAMDYDKKTVKDGALWTAEGLPIDSLLYVPLMANDSRSTEESTKDLKNSDILKKITGCGLSRINFGGDETTGQGFVALKFLGGDS